MLMPTLVRELKLACLCLHWSENQSYNANAYTGQRTKVIMLMPTLDALHRELKSRCQCLVLIHFSFLVVRLQGSCTHVYN